MKIVELDEYYKNLSDKELHEAIDKTNTSGFLSEDLVKITRAAQNTESWTEYESADALFEDMNKWQRSSK